MPRRIRIPDRVIVHERVPIPGLRPLRGHGDDRIGLGEPAERGVHPTRREPVDAKFGLVALPCKLVVGAEIAQSVP